MMKSSKLAVAIRLALIGPAFALFGNAVLMILTAPAAAADLSFLDPPQVVTASPGPEYRADHRTFQGIPSLARSPGGRLWAVWYASPSGGEDRNNYIIYDRNRNTDRQILMAVFTEEDVVAGTPGKATRLRELVSRGKRQDNS